MSNILSWRLPDVKIVLILTLIFAKFNSVSRTSAKHTLSGTGKSASVYPRITYLTTVQHYNRLSPVRMKNTFYMISLLLAIPCTSLAIVVNCIAMPSLLETAHAQIDHHS